MDTFLAIVNSAPFLQKLVFSQLRSVESSEANVNTLRVKRTLVCWCVTNKMPVKDRLAELQQRSKYCRDTDAAEKTEMKPLNKKPAGEGDFETFLETAQEIATNISQEKTLGDVVIKCRRFPHFGCSILFCPIIFDFKLFLDVTLYLHQKSLIGQPCYFLFR